MNTPLRAGARAALGLSLALVLLAGCGRGAREETPLAAGEEAGPATPQEDSLVILARRLYESLSRGDTQPIEDRLADDAYDILVGEGIAEGSQHYESRHGGERPDWRPLLRWAEERPPATIRRAYAAPSPHDPRNIMVTLELEEGYFYLLFNGETISKVVTAMEPLDWD